MVGPGGNVFFEKCCHVVFSLMDDRAGIFRLSICFTVIFLDSGGLGCSFAGRCRRAGETLSFSLAIDK